MYLRNMKCSTSNAVVDIVGSSFNELDDFNVISKEIIEYN